MNKLYPHAIYLVSPLALTLLAGGCSPTVKVEAPDKPIVVNMNVNIKHRLRVKLDKDVRKTIQSNPDLF